MGFSLSILCSPFVLFSFLFSPSLLSFSSFRYSTPEDFAKLEEKLKELDEEEGEVGELEGEGNKQRIVDEVERGPAIIIAGRIKRFVKRFFFYFILFFLFLSSPFSLFKKNANKRGGEMVSLGAIEQSLFSVFPEVEGKTVVAVESISIKSPEGGTEPLLAALVCSSSVEKEEEVSGQGNFLIFFSHFFSYFFFFRLGLW